MGIYGAYSLRNIMIAHLVDALSRRSIAMETIMPMPASGPDGRRPPTQRQLVVLSMLDQWIKLHDGISPTYRELAEWCSCKSVRTIAEHIYYLHAKGLVERIPGELRSFSVTDLGGKYLKLAPGKSIRIRVG